MRAFCNSSLLRSIGVRNLRAIMVYLLKINTLYH